jgi:hypothetical protein
LEGFVLYSFDYFFTSIWLFTEVFVGICRISMSRKRKLKKVCFDLEVQEQNVVASKFAIEEHCSIKVGN